MHFVKRDSYYFSKYSDYPTGFSLCLICLIKTLELLIIWASHLYIYKEIQLYIYKQNGESDDYLKN